MASTRQRDLGPSARVKARPVAPVLTQGLAEPIRTADSPRPTARQAAAFLEPTRNVPDTVCPTLTPLARLKMFPDTVSPDTAPHAADRLAPFPTALMRERDLRLIDRMELSPPAVLLQWRSGEPVSSRLQIRAL